MGLEIPSDVILKATAGAGAGSEEPLPVAEKDRKPLVVCVTRLVAQKGIHLIRYAIWRTREMVRREREWVVRACCMGVCVCVCVCVYMHAHTAHVCNRLDDGHS